MVDGLRPDVGCLWSAKAIEFRFASASTALVVAAPRVYIHSMSVQAAMATTIIHRAYRLTLDPTPQQARKLSQWAGAARAMYNHAIAAKQASHRRWLQEVAFATYEQELTEEQARKSIKVPIPTAYGFNAWLTETRNTHHDAAEKGLLLPGRDGREHDPWMHEVNRSALVSAMRHADDAWTNWIDSLTGTRAGRKIGYPRFKKRGVARDSFTITHDRKSLGIRLATTRRLRIPTFGEIRIHDHANRLHRKLHTGTVEVTSVTVSRHGPRWYASLTVEETIPTPRLSKRKRAAGVIGVDLGVKVAAALSNGELVPNPRFKASHAKKLARLQKALTKSQKGSRNRAQIVQKIGRLTHLEARQREGHAHNVANRLVHTWAIIGIEDLNVAGMTRSSRGTIEKPGKNVRAKAGLNRSILDVAPAQIRHLLDYKTAWSGTQLVVIDRWAPTSKKCSTCGAVKAKLTLAERTFECEACGLVLDRDINAARNIAALAAVAPSTEETQNARRAAPRKPVSSTVKQRTAMKREDPPGSSPPSNGRTFHTVLVQVI
ncbi:RNA-guided endonuclease TnpB family protein [Paeniglutamicibacter kerguelensis]